LEVPICDVRDTKLILASRDEKKKMEKTVEDTFCPFIFIDVRLQAEKYISFFLSFTFKGKKTFVKEKILVNKRRMRMGKNPDTSEIIGRHFSEK